MIDKKQIYLILTAISIIIFISGCGQPPKRPPEGSDTEVFGIYSANLDGTDFNVVLTNSYQEMTHVRVSPNGQWITFSRYNKIVKDDCAEMHTGSGLNYEDTEILIMKADGSNVKTLIPSEKGKINVNSDWVNDKELLYLYGDDDGTEIRRIILDDNMDVEKVKKVKILDTLMPLDPHQVDNKIVFPAVDILKATQGIWMIDDGELKQLTFPKNASGTYVTRDGAYDNDVKISPDGSKIAFMRFNAERGTWHLYVMDISTGIEQDLSLDHIPYESFALDGLPHWSPDGSKIIFRHSDYDVLTNSEIYTVNPDGSEREIVDVPSIADGYYQLGVSFYSNDRILYHAKIINVKCEK